jgi:hypothetical protein
MQELPEHVGTLEASKHVGTLEALVLCSECNIWLDKHMHLV